MILFDVTAYESRAGHECTGRKIPLTARRQLHSKNDPIYSLESAKLECNTNSRCKCISSGLLTRRRYRCKKNGRFVKRKWGTTRFKKGWCYYPGYFRTYNIHEGSGSQHTARDDGMGNTAWV